MGASPMRTPSHAMSHHTARHSPTVGSYGGRGFSCAKYPCTCSARIFVRTQRTGATREKEHAASQGPAVELYLGASLHLPHSLALIGSAHLWSKDEKARKFSTRRWLVELCSGSKRGNAHFIDHIAQPERGQALVTDRSLH